jgi:hypothetical protein
MYKLSNWIRSLRRKLNGTVSLVIKFDSDSKFKNVFLASLSEEAG